MKKHFKKLLMITAFVLCFTTTTNQFVYAEPNIRNCIVYTDNSSLFSVAWNPGNAIAFQREPYLINHFTTGSDFHHSSPECFEITIRFDRPVSGQLILRDTTYGINMPLQMENVGSNLWTCSIQRYYFDCDFVLLLVTDRHVGLRSFSYYHI